MKIRGRFEEGEREGGKPEVTLEVKRSRPVRNNGTRTGGN